MALPPLTFRSIKGSPLSENEGDDNIHNLDTRITDIEEGPDTAISIDHFTVAGNQLSITLTDSNVQGPFSLPTANWNARDAWAPTTAYAAYDVISFGGAVYLVNVAHTSASSFSPTASDGLGHDLYKKLIQSVRGPQGKIGHAGTGGKDGDAGPPGRRGRTGLKGDKGDTGSTGSAGTPGGPPGPRGRSIVGPPGPDGPAGPPGPFGRRGKQGLTGATGSKGDTGSAGTPGGPIGKTGKHGPPGTVGPQGEQGPPGKQGKTGKVGIQVKAQDITTSGSTLTINRALGEIVRISLASNITAIVISNPAPTGELTKLLMKITQTGSFTMAGWPSGTVWVGGAPTISSGAGKIDRLVTASEDGGTSWFNDVIGQNYA